MYSLHIFYHDGRQASHDLTSETTVFGRADSCTAQLLDPSISKQHFGIEEILGDYFIYDMGSKNGTYLNGQKITNKRNLQNRDIIEAGDLHLIVVDQITTNPTFNTDSLMHVEGYKVELTVLDGAHKGLIYEVSNVLCTIGTSKNQVVILQQRPAGVFLTQIEGLPVTLNDVKIDHKSHKLNHGDVLKICGTLLKVVFKEHALLK